MYDSLRVILQARSDMLDGGQFEELATNHTLPLVIFLEDQQFIVETHERLVDILGRFAAQRREARVAKTVVSILAVEIPRHSRFRVWTKYHELDSHGTILRHVEALHYCRQTATGMKSEMIEVSHIPQPELWAIRPEMATIIG